MAITVKFDKPGRDGNPVGVYNNKLVLLDKNDQKSKEIKIGETWSCTSLFEKEKFMIVNAICRDVTVENPTTEDAKPEKVYTPSKYGLAIFDFLKNGIGNALISAVAGSGKTTTLLELLKMIPLDKTVLFLAFNRSIVGELKTKVPARLTNVEIKTCHAFGMKHVTNKFESELESSKYQNIAKRMSVKWADVDDSNMASYIATVCKLVGLGRLSMIQTKDQLEVLAEKHDIDTINGECERAVEIIKIGSKDTTIVDYTDMIYFPNIYDVNVKQYDYVFIDECQDLNTCQRELMMKAVKPETGRFIAVGDESQAIYGFAGADIESFNILKAIPNTISLPLSVCYRCDTEMINLAKTIVPQIEARTGASAGYVGDGSIDEIKIGDMVLCRNTFPLVKLCMHFLSKGIPAHVMGQDIGENLIAALKNTKEPLVSKAIAKLYRDLDKIEKKILKKGETKMAKLDPKYQQFLEKISVIESLSEDIEYTSDVIEKITSIFNDDESSESIILSTVHKAKGLESDRVHIIHEELMPSKYCLDIPWMMVQERNLMYVAYTRAKHHLAFVKDFNAYAKTTKSKKH